jgi:hypothetical protein
MTEQTAHPTDDPSTFLDPPEPVADPDAEERVPSGADILGRANEVDPRRPMSLDELAGIRDQAEVEAELDRAGPTKLEEPRPLVVIMLPMEASAASNIMLVVADHFEGCVVDMQGDRILVLPKPSP